MIQFRYFYLFFRFIRRFTLCIIDGVNFGMRTAGRMRITASNLNSVSNNHAAHGGIRRRNKPAFAAFRNGLKHPVAVLSTRVRHLSAPVLSKAFPF